MVLYTQEQQEAIFKKVQFPHGLTVTQSLRVLWWSFFSHAKYNAMLKYMDEGRIPRATYEKVLKEFKAR